MTLATFLLCHNTPLAFIQTTFYGLDIARPHTSYQCEGWTVERPTVGTQDWGSSRPWVFILSMSSNLDQLATFTCGLLPLPLMGHKDRTDSRRVRSPAYSGSHHDSDMWRPHWEAQKSDREFQRNFWESHKRITLVGKGKKFHKEANISVKTGNCFLSALYDCKNKLIWYDWYDCIFYVYVICICSVFILFHSFPISTLKKQIFQFPLFLSTFSIFFHFPHSHCVAVTSSEARRVHDVPKPRGRRQGNWHRQGLRISTWYQGPNKEQM